LFGLRMRGNKQEIYQGRYCRKCAVLHKKEIALSSGLISQLRV
jgi:hypothetical protein